MLHPEQHNKRIFAGGATRFRLIGPVALVRCPRITGTSLCSAIEKEEEEEEEENKKTNNDGR